jgi:tetratricopeptide (TPR) repeat protein
MPMKHDKQPVTAEDWFAHGNALAARGELEQAIACYEKVRAACPLAPGVYHNLGSTLCRLRRFPEALDQFQKAKALAPGNADIHHNLGWVLQQMDRLDEALACYQQAVRLDPRLHGSYNNLANCLQSLGRFAEARDAYRQAIDAAPDNALYYGNFMQLQRLDAGHPYFAALEELASRVDSLTPDNQAQLHFAFGNALADAGQNERAFAHILRGNAMYRRSVPYDEATTLALLSRLPGWFAKDVFKSVDERRDTPDGPVFIVGMPRSGSSLIEQILASHSQVFGAGERAEFGHAVFTAITPDGLNLPDINIQAVHNVSARQFASLGADYLRRIHAALPEARSYRHFTDKYPFNFSHLGLIRLALPNARIIHCRRAPVETCLSIFSRTFRDVPFGYDLGELGRYYRAYDALMAHWRRVLPAHVMLEVQYEELVGDLESTVRKMLAHCGLAWDERCLAFHQTRRQVTTASASQVRQPLYRTSLRRWRPDDELLKPLLDGLGPELAGEGGLA